MVWVKGQLSLDPSDNLTAGAEELAQMPAYLSDSAHWVPTGESSVSDLHRSICKESRKAEIEDRQQSAAGHNLHASAQATYHCIAY